jgi:hypothetical protein
LRGAEQLGAGGSGSVVVEIATKRIRLTSSILLDGKHAEKGSVHAVTQPVAKDLILQGVAVPLRLGWWAAAVAACLALGVGALLWWSVAHRWW